MNWIADWYAKRMTAQLAIRLPDEVVESMDRLVDRRRFANRTEIVRVAVERLLAEVRERELDEAIVAGYRRVPDTTPDAWIDAATRELVAEEPW